MGIQRPDISKFKKQTATSNKKNKRSEPDDEQGNMFMQMGKSVIPMLPKWVKSAAGAAIFFLIWGLISFNYCMITWLHWGYFLSVVLVLELLQIGNDLKIGIKIKQLLKTKKS